MIIIKRYPNRKLYDTDAKRYVTLVGIARIIQSGQEVQIVDNESGEDLTTLTLTQIIVEQEKKQAGFLPRAVLTGLIQAGGQTLTSLRRTLASPLDLLHHVDQDISARLHTLVEMGELTFEEGRQLHDKLLAAGRKHVDALLLEQDEIERILVEYGIPSKEDIDQINERLDALLARLDAGSEDGD